MSKSMLVNVTAQEEHRVAIVDNGILDIFEIETLSREHLKGDIFKATVEGVNPALEAAFVNYGGERAGFLPLDEVNFKLYPSRGEGAAGKGRGARITRHLEKGMEVLVQVIRDSFANKPPTLSTYYSLPGRYLVLMPGGDAAGISRKIEDAEHRDRLRRTLDELTVPEGFGVIVRTAGMETSSRELQADLDALLELWRTIERASSQVKTPALIFQERDLVIRTIRDYFTSDIEEVLIDDEPTCARAKKFFEAHMPERAGVVRLYTGDKPIFSKYNLEDQIERIYKRTVELKSGGSISIDQTEALTAIDVNSARSVRSASSEDTAARTNLEAAEEIARQLRLRDIGGLVVIDFIDMESAKHIRQVERAFTEAMARDKARYDVTRISKLGLMEVSRQRIRSTKASSSFMECPVCGGDGTIRTPEAAARAAFRKVQARVARGDIAGVKVYLPPEVALYLLNEKRDDLYHLETRLKVRIDVVPETRMKPHQFEMEDFRRDDADIVPIVTADTVDAALASGSIPATPRPPEPVPAIPAVGAVGEAPAVRRKRRRRRRRRAPGLPAPGATEPAADAAISAEPRHGSALADSSLPNEDAPVFSEGPESDQGEAQVSQATSRPAAGAPAENRPGSASSAEPLHRRRRRRRRRGRGRHRPQGPPQMAPRTSEANSEAPGHGTWRSAAAPHEDRSPGHAGGEKASLARWDGAPPPVEPAKAGGPPSPSPQETDLSSGPGNTAPSGTEKPRRRWWRRSLRG